MDDIPEQRQVRRSFNGNTYELVIAEQIDGSLCLGCAFFDDAQGCPKMSRECFEQPADETKTKIWKLVASQR